MPTTTRGGPYCKMLYHNDLFYQHQGFGWVRAKSIVHFSVHRT